MWQRTVFWRCLKCGAEFESPPKDGWCPACNVGRVVKVLI